LGKISLQERELDITRPSHPAPLSKRLHILYFHFVLDSNHDGEISCASQWGGGTCLKGMMLKVRGGTVVHIPLAGTFRWKQKSTTWQLADGPEPRIGVCLSAVVGFLKTWPWKI